MDALCLYNQMQTLKRVSSNLKVISNSPKLSLFLMFASGYINTAAIFYFLIPIKTLFYRV